MWFNSKCHKKQNTKPFLIKNFEIITNFYFFKKQKAEDNKKKVYMLCSYKAVLTKYYLIIQIIIQIIIE